MRPYNIAGADLVFRIDILFEAVHSSPSSALSKNGGATPHLSHTSSWRGA
jgi:hypothetical protein